ncbi:uncharacterized protein LOC133825660 [Humulus lupulus]|uniref:uncharacterized protein LOC133825660 n=1 Tax=Humulus lupulus TaxID=3486 RepID=UPI002B4161E9|nr:uncharacterized protein LOC133825660 [Humulus lupulus]
MIQSQEASLRNLEIQVGQLVNEMCSRHQGSLPSDTINPRQEGKEECKAITLRSVKELENSKKNSGHEGMPQHQHPDSLISKQPPPFPQRFEKQKQDAQFKKFLDVLKRLHILTKKRRLGEFETVALTKDCSSFLQNKLPPKMKDPGSFTISCTTRNSYSGMALCDLGASINLMPMSVFKRLGIREVRPTTVTLQLADRSLAHPDGKIEDVLVRVDKFIFPTDFIVLDYEADMEVPIILGRPFLATCRTLIDMEKGKLTMRAQDEQVTFKVFNLIRSPNELGECLVIHVMDSTMEEGAPTRYSKRVRMRLPPEEF